MTTLYMLNNLAKTWGMVCHPSCAPALSSLSIILCFLSLMSPSPPPSCHILFYFATIRGTNEKQEGEGESLGGWCPHIITTPSNCPLPISALHLSVFLSDSWQPVGYSGPASIPRCIHLPTDLRKHIVVCVALLYSGGGGLTELSLLPTEHGGH